MYLDLGFVSRPGHDIGLNLGLLVLVLVWFWYWSLSWNGFGLGLDLGFGIGLLCMVISWWDQNWDQLRLDLEISQ